MDSLERDASEVLSLIRSLKNTLAPINRIPVEVISLIPDYCHEHCADQVLIALTHVCHGWRDMFTSRSSLWTRLDSLDLDKIRTYIQRSKSSPLDVRLQHIDDNCDLEDVLPPVIPHIPRLKSLVVRAHVSHVALSNLRNCAPFLEELDINNIADLTPALGNKLFGGDLSSLRKLRLRGFTTHLPWNNMANLRDFNLSCPDGCEIIVTRLLDFLESAPLLYTVTLENLIPGSSNAPPARIVPLPHLNSLTITDEQPSILLKHLSIPVGASLKLWLFFEGEFPLRDYLPETSPNLTNLSHITTVNLRFNHCGKFVRLSGPSGSLRLLDRWEDDVTMDHRILRSFGSGALSAMQKLTISLYAHSYPVGIEDCPVFQTLSSIKNLRTLVLSECNNQPFILALNPEKNASGLVLCPHLQELTLYTSPLRHHPYTRRLITMAKNRASRGAKLSLLTIVDLGELGLRDEVFELREDVMHLDYRIGSEPPRWDVLHGKDGSTFQE